MIKLLLLKTERAMLPEIEVYKSFLEKKNILVDIKSISEINEKIENYNIIWNFMGTDLKKYSKNQYIIHDYRSASSRCFPKLRDKIKKIINIKPNIRIFLNKDLEKYYNFKDNIKTLNIDMGINDLFFKVDKKINKKYKFVYLGEINKRRESDKLLKWFIESEFKKENFLLIGPYDLEIYNKYNKYNNLIFLGKIKYKEVPEYLSLCEYAFNIIPNKFPFNFQTSTKLLEYLALNLKVISNKTDFVQKFLQENKNIDFITVNSYEIISKELLENFNFKFIDMKKYSWEYILRGKIEFIINDYLKYLSINKRGKGKN